MAAMLVFGLVVLHVSFAVIPQNRNQLRAITTGQFRPVKIRAMTIRVAAAAPLISPRQEDQVGAIPFR